MDKARYYWEAANPIARLVVVGTGLGILLAACTIVAFF